MDVSEAGSFSLGDFRAAVAAAARSERDHIIVAYCRKAFLQTGVPGFFQFLYSLNRCLWMITLSLFCAQPLKHAGVPGHARTSQRNT